MTEPKPTYTIGGDPILPPQGDGAKHVRIHGRKMDGNPRQITRKQFERLKADLDELGDLSGVVHDLNSDQFIGGNQRSEAFSINDCEIEIVQELPEADRQGTVAHGFVVWRGARYAYRQVRWTPEKCRKANVVANLAGGSWDFDALANWDAAALTGWGMDGETLRNWGRNYSALANMLQSEAPEWEGMPEFENEDITGDTITIKVHFLNKDDLQKFGGLIEQSVNEKTKYIWYPKQSGENLKKYRCVDEP